MEKSLGLESSEIPEQEDFLEEIGSRIRGLRAKRGMTRKMLAENSGVSERYLANLEQGTGNISVGLLRKVSMALRAEVGDLLPGTTPATPEQNLIRDFIGRLPRDQQQAALQFLYQQFSSRASNSRIALIGLRGAGKSTLGKLLEDRLGYRFIRLTEEIEALAGIQVAEILSLYGQHGYRRFEEKALKNALATEGSCCIETGGSIVSELKELNLLLTTCLVVWVKTDPEDYMQRLIEQGDLRPMADNADAMTDLQRILKEREPYYEKAHAILDTSGKLVEESYTELVGIIDEHKRA